ncbi:MAG: pyridoxamine 5'-phosphate oxidase family protein [Nocardiaceae bacterium]|nr:pyridoxamine 5'-phosphate oxidase family protein [Nocardiaceae bacterium]
MTTRKFADVGFHAGELAIQHKAGVRREAERLVGMMQPVELRGGITGFLANSTFAVITARDSAGRLWASPLTGRHGFLNVTSASELTIHATFPEADPLHGLPPDQLVGIVVVEFAARRRVRINGTLTHSTTVALTITVEQAYGNCPQYIQQRALEPSSGNELSKLSSHYRGVHLRPRDVALIRRADTFFLGTSNPGRGTDASHRGGPPGFVRAGRDHLWWPDYPGNNMFNSLGNVAVDSEAALLFCDFTTGETLHLHGTSEIEWGEIGRPGDDGRTGRIATFTPQQIVAGYLLPAHETAHRPYPRNPALTD